MAPSSKMSLPNARPYPFTFPSDTTALMIIDMQREFLDPNGFGAIQCGDPEIFASVRNIVPTVQKVLEAARDIGLQVIHTREGHRPDLSDLPASKKLGQLNAPHGHHTMGIGDQGPMGRLLVRGERGHDIIDELRPLPGELVIDKPGKGSFWGTGLHKMLLARGITHLIFAGVTTECCVTTTLRECNDRGKMVTTSLDIICGQDGLFGYVGASSDFFLSAMESENLAPAWPPWPAENSLPAISELQQRYHGGLTSPEAIVELVFERIEKYEKVDPAVWISRQTKEQVLAAAKELSAKYAGKPLPPLFGIPFAVKDNIDVDGISTTAACKTFAYVAKSTAPAVQLLLNAGALYIGKLNMDQLATGLSGCRSPYGTPHSFYSKDHIPGGSSSGPAAAVAAGLVSFALGTDTAGSGRIPAAFNGVVGFKPTKGTISARGVVPACKSLDTLSIMAPILADARRVWYVTDQHDALDPFAKNPASLATWKNDYRGPKDGGFTFAAPPQSLLETCSKEYQDLFQTAVQTLRSCGGRLVDIDYTPFALASDLLYEASFVHERIACIGHEFLASNLDSLHPTIKSLFKSVMESNLKPWHVFRDQGLQAQYTMQAQKIFNAPEGGIDVLFVPSAPCHPTIEEMEEDPIGLNTKVGTFSHFGNVVDLCGVSVNAGWTEDGLPFGVTFLGGSGYDGRVLDVAAVFEDAVGV